MKPKIAVFGAGFVGSTTAQRLVEKEIGDVAMIDIVEGMPQGKALDMMESAPVEVFGSKITGSNDPAACARADLIIVTSGLPRKPGMSRDDLLFKNAEICSGVAENIRGYAPEAVVIVVSNPLDVMTHVVAAKTGFPKNRVLGMAGVLDTARLRYFIADALGGSMRCVDAMVLGGHGDDMVPLPRYATVNGIALEALLPKSKIDEMITRARNGGAKIVGLLKSGSAYYAPSSAVVAMAASVLRDEKRVLPCAAWCTGQYGLHDLFEGVPCVVGKNGVERIIQLQLTADELAQLKRSADHVIESVQKLNL